jgi:hypothetical protein
MATLTLPLHLDADTLPVILARIGAPLKGDSQLHMLAEMPARPIHILSNTTVNAAAVTAGYSASDASKITTELSRRGHGK